MKLKFGGEQFGIMKMILQDMPTRVEEMKIGEG
jgi:hypothetical protein